MWLFFWFLFAIAVGVFASNRGRSGFGWFLLSLVISPLLGLLFVAVSKNLNEKTAATKTPGEQSHVKCPACAEWVLPEATVCKHCGGALTPDGQFVAKREERRKMEKNLGNQELMWGIGAIAGLIALVAILSKVF